MKRLTLVVLSGLPGAGKSSTARSLSVKHGLAILARDDIRPHFPDISENDLTLKLSRLVASYLRNGLSVVVDSPNLDPKDQDLWFGVAEETNALIKWQYLDTPVDECVRRDASRPNPVGASEIRAMAIRCEKSIEELSQRTLLWTM